MTLITHIKNLLTSFPYRKICLFGLVLVAGYTFAANDPQNDSDVVRAIVQVLNLVFTVITFLLTPAIILAGWLLSPDWTMGDFFGLRPYFIQVWVLVSNLVYIIFAMMLLYMAVMQIFSGKSNYAFKNKLPKFLVGILIVPFTWLIVSWTLSFANLAVAAVLSIPSGAIANMQDPTDGKDKGPFHKRVIPTKFSLDFGADAPGTDTCGDNGQTKDGKTKCISAAEFITYNQSGPFFIIMIYAYDIFKIQNTELVDFASVCGGEDGAPSDAKGCVNSIGKLLRKFGVALITTTFFAIILIALCWVLLARAFKLWIYVMFSPLFGLAYAVGDEGLGKTLGSKGGSSEGASIGELGFLPFFKLAMVPVLVSAVLSFGILFIGVVQNTFTSGSMTKTSSGSFCTSGQFMVKYCITEGAKKADGSGSFTSSIVIGDDSKNDSKRKGNYAITFEFGSMISDFVGNSAGKTVTGIAGGLAEAGTDIFAHIILSIIALAVMWIGVKTAVSYDAITEKAFAPFARFGESVGKAVINIPSYLPTPHPAFAAFNPATFDAIATKMNTNVDAKVKDHRNSMDDMLNGKSQALDGAIDGFVNSTNSFDEAVQKFGNSATKSPEKAAELIVQGINKIDKTKLTTDSQEKISDFKNQVDANSGNREGLKTVLENPRFAALITEMDTKTELKGITRLAGHLGASTSSSGSSDPTIGLAEVDSSSGGFIFKNTSQLKINSTGVITGKMSTEQAKKIKEKADGDDSLSDNDTKELFGTSDLTSEQRKALVKKAKEMLE